MCARRESILTWNGVTANAFKNELLEETTFKLRSERGVGGGYRVYRRKDRRKTYRKRDSFPMEGTVCVKILKGKGVIVRCYRDSSSRKRGT
jgi:hypothetical protein